MRRRGQTLVATLIVIAIMGILAVALLKPWAVGGTAKPARADGKGTTVPGLVKLKAEDDVCRSNLGQVRLAIQVAQSSGEDAAPPSITDLKLPKSFLSCPLGKEPYEYDPTAGTAKCVHPGHEKY